MFNLEFVFLIEETACSVNFCFFQLLVRSQCVAIHDDVKHVHRQWTGSRRRMTNTIIMFCTSKLSLDWLHSLEFFMPFQHLTWWYFYLRSTRKQRSSMLIRCAFSVYTMSQNNWFCFCLFRKVNHFTLSLRFLILILN